jgi:hypothetical protein
MSQFDNWQSAHERAVAGTKEGHHDYIQGVASMLGQIAEEDVAKLPEDIFVQMFLPLLTRLFSRLLAPEASAKEGELKELPHKVGVADWISIAGTPYKEVDVFDPKTNQVLFRCPPLFDYNGVNPVRQAADRRSVPISEIAAMAEKLRLIHPKQSEAYLVMELSKRTLTMSSGARLAQTVLRWNEVFKRYGRHLSIDVNSNSTPSSSVEQTQQATSTMEADYEDF